MTESVFVINYTNSMSSSVMAAESLESNWNFTIHRNQMQFMDAVWGRGVPSLGSTRALKSTNGILIPLRVGREEKKQVIFNHEVLHLLY